MSRPSKQLQAFDGSVRSGPASRVVLESVFAGAGRWLQNRRRDLVVLAPPPWTHVAGAVVCVLLPLLVLRPRVAVRAAAGARAPATSHTQEVVPANLKSPDQVCAACHQAIYASYERTSMALGSGPVTPNGESIIPGGFLHAASGVRYNVFSRDGRAWMSFARDAQPQPAPSTAHTGAQLHGERPLDYFVGSGKHGRTYLYQVDGAWYELPINYYTRRATWDMAPAFDRVTTMPADLPTDPNCLHCHATGVAEALPGTRSRYPGAPFAQGGVGCSACHGNPAAHLAAGGRGPIVNPGRLGAALRDSACLQCHLEGDAVVYRPGRSLAQFEPGENLTATAVYFVRAGRTGGGGRAASQYEALLRSACKRASGDRLTCTSCHDPHASPAPAERVAYYRAKCLACHARKEFAAEHHPEQPDCARCHMPSRVTTDISHEQSVDHDIERLPLLDNSSRARTGEELLPVGGWSASERELGLAYAQMAARGDRSSGERALRLLAHAEAAGASDPVLHTQLGFLKQMAGDREQAMAEYRAALAEDPLEATALGNLAVLDATAGRVRDAVTRLTTLVDHDPGQTAAGLNLAFIECRLGAREAARLTLAKLAHYNPDDAALRNFSATGVYVGQRCELNSAMATGREDE